jgi:coenzyme F420-reducing hydrogenase alpha subunit
MFTIHVLLKTLPGGYAPILATYNANRPAGSEQIYKAGVCEGGFEIPLNAQEREHLEQRAKQLGRRLDANSYVRQLRWNKGKLQSGNFAGFTEAELTLLYSALVAVFGAENVKALEYED